MPLLLGLCAHGFLDFVCFFFAEFFYFQNSFGKRGVLFIKFDMNFHVLVKVKSWSCALREVLFYFKVLIFHLIGEGLQQFTQKHFHPRARILCKV